MEERDRATVGATGAAIRAMRLERHMSQSELARLSGISQAYASKIEAGRATPSESVLARVSSALGVPVSALADSRSLNQAIAERLLGVPGIEASCVASLMSLHDVSAKRSLLSVIDSLLGSSGRA